MAEFVGGVDERQQMWVVLRLLAYASQWPSTDSRVQSKFACVLQQIKSRCRKQPRDAYAAAVQLATAPASAVSLFPHRHMQAAVATVVQLAESSDFQTKLSEMFDTAARARLRKVFVDLVNGAETAKSFAVAAAAAANGPAEASNLLSNKKMTAVVYVALYFLPLFFVLRVVLHNTQQLCARARAGGFVE